MRSQSLQIWRTKCLYLTQLGVSSRIFPTSTSPAAQHGPSGRARARGAKIPLGNTCTGKRIVLPAYPGVNPGEYS